MKEDKNESRWDKLLNIRTMGRDDTHADQYRYPYELILSILVDTFISKISLPMQPVPEIRSISGA